MIIAKLKPGPYEPSESNPSIDSEYETIGKVIKIKSTDGNITFDLSTIKTRRDLSNIVQLKSIIVWVKWNNGNNKTFTNIYYPCNLHLSIDNGQSWIFNFNEDYKELNQNNIQFTKQEYKSIW